MLPSFAIAAAVLLATSLLPTRAGDELLPHAAPADVGMSADRLAVIDRVVQRAIDAGGFPGAAVVVGRHGAIVWERGYGALGGGSSAAVDPERTLFDLASLTKVVATSAAAMVLVDEGRLGLDDPVGRYLPEFRAGAKGRVTIRHLLRHRSGLPAGRTLASSAAESRRLVLGTALEAAPGERYEYSDLGPIVLGFVIERITGEPLDRFVQHAVYARLGMQSTTFRPARALAPRIAATEPGVPRGEVHDRASHALGGVAGHAGLFGTAGDLAIFAQFMLDRGSRHGVRLVRDSTVAAFTRRGAEDRQALGWETCAGGGSCGQRLSRTAFGHTGFTGTSLWVDPERDLFVIVLTNWIAGRPGGGVAPVAVLHDVRADVADLAALAVVDGAPAPMPDRMRSDARIGW
ncbi:beta-lactamase (plasmid) [Gemmatirosa kalamazoonensis]|uniref:Beta-lactamase n=1 Tax=Gemmatirosa kalamazoonensis TaxID=861299 RepID=W0RSV9_9BACT|nr:serine hydrolase [Gemmatirosa kalamazoonensis]AHG93400.1 beta-lactamase [Gemmatirosa kalamazoonensis]